MNNAELLTAFESIRNATESQTAAADLDTLRALLAHTMNPDEQTAPTWGEVRRAWFNVSEVLRLRGCRQSRAGAIETVRQTIMQKYFPV